ncbi:MAG: hypothetical protein KDK07_23345 [Bauldia sp.]|nr:hypothetical protein [Bauldia sp.]
MNRLADILEDLAAADAATHHLRQLAATQPLDPVLAVNLDALLRRRGDLERQMAALLSAEQNDLIRIAVTGVDESSAPAADAARSVALFQRLLTAAFDAILTGAPKARYAPSPEAMERSTLHFVRPPSDSHEIHLAIANDYLLAIESDLDRALGLVCELLVLRSKVLIRELAQHLGIATVSAAYALFELAAAQRLSISIRWRKRDHERRKISVSHADARTMTTIIEAIHDDRMATVEQDCELLGIDEVGGSFRIAITGGQVISGDLTDGFPRGGAWTTRRWYRALLLRASRLGYADGEETVRWSLTGLVAQA